MTSNTYFLSYACAEILDNGVIEFDTYAEALADCEAREISGYAVSMNEIDFQGALAEEIRKSEGYEDRREALTV